jgi:hypothetical protein
MRTSNATHCVQLYIRSANNIVSTLEVFSRLILNFIICTSLTTRASTLWERTAAMADVPQLDAAAAVGAKRPLEPVQDESNKLPRVERPHDSAIKVLAAATAAMAAAEAAPSAQPQDTSISTTPAAPSAPTQEPANSVALTAAAADTATAVSPLKLAAPAAATAVAAAPMPANPAAVPISSPLTAGEKACLARVELPAETGTRLVVLWQLEVEGVDREEWWPCTLQRSQNPRQDSHNRAVFELHYEAANGMCALFITYYAAYHCRIVEPYLIT